MSTNAQFPPYELTKDDGSFEGIDVEAAGAIAGKLGLEAVNNAMAELKEDGTFRKIVDKYITAE